MTAWHQIIDAACVAACAGLTLFVASLCRRITRLREDIAAFGIVVPRGLPGERGPPGETCSCECAQKAKAEKMNKAGVAYACQHTDSAGNDGMNKVEEWPVPKNQGIWVLADCRGFSVEDGQGVLIEWTQQEALVLARCIVGKYGSDIERRAIGLLERVSQ